MQMRKSELFEMTEPILQIPDWGLGRWQQVETLSMIIRRARALNHVHKVSFQNDQFIQVKIKRYIGRELSVSIKYTPR
jgi:hypothetical protein